MTTKQAPPNVRFRTGMTGVYYTAAELSTRNYIATITSRNAATIDILAATSDGKVSFGIQVKTNGERGTQSYWLLSDRTKRDVSSNLFYIFVNLRRNSRPDFYIVRSKDVSKRMRSEKHGNSIWYWYRRDLKDQNRWDRLP